MLSVGMHSEGSWTYPVLPYVRDFTLLRLYKDRSKAHKARKSFIIALNSFNSNVFAVPLMVHERLYLGF
jgi:hypothetical protein